MKKKIVKLNGGLGNQMFQYAFALALSKSLNLGVTLDLSWFESVKTHNNVTQRVFELDVFNINYEIATKEDLSFVEPSIRYSKPKRLLFKLFKLQKYNPMGNTFIDYNPYNFNKNLLKSNDYYYYDGYFQNEKYFQPIRKELLNNFHSTIQLDEKNKSILDKISTTNSVSIHVRRGDYITLESANDFHGLCSLEYYKKAIEYVVNKVENPHFFLFSDDIDWVIKNLKLDYPFSIIDFNQNKGWLDLNLMKNCKHNILANSTFSWWGAWLNQNPYKLTISPKKWTNKKFRGSIIPKGWIKL